MRTFLTIFALIFALPAMAQNTEVHGVQGGDEWHIKSAGKLILENGASHSYAGQEQMKVRALSLNNDSTTAGGILGWSNDTESDIIVQRLIIHLTTEATGTCNADFGVAADTTTSSDDLLDGVDIGSATGVFDNNDDTGTNGTTRALLQSSQALTGSADSCDPAGLEGNAYLHYFEVQ